jgi:hypothetical protein
MSSRQNAGDTEIFLLAKTINLPLEISGTYRSTPIVGSTLVTLQKAEELLTLFQKAL